MLELVLAQMTHTDAQPPDKSNTVIIITIIFGGRSNKLQDTIFKISKTFWVPEGRI